MVTIGTLEAKTRLSSLLDLVASGEEVVITRRGRAVARLVPAAPAEARDAAHAAARLKELRRGATLGGLSWRALRDEGRR
ncbi:MAG: type II toxin-antitoxin system prevent-host-death family antitoxin [Rhodospirillales bacterium]|nr:type II toxin-antitoxin system prevent-host-death family antitoxin [Rhodospirillales bacterium]